jgi:aryl-alcohol dehydrogenase-like predicted oxidoreductase
MSYGIANQHGQIALDEARRIVHHARASGIDTLDTAEAYGDSERRLGEIGVSGWQVISKVAFCNGGFIDVEERMIRAVRGSLERLRIDQLYAVLLHRPDQLLERGGDRLYRALLKIKQAGLSRKIGVSVYSPSELEALCRHYDIDLVQAPFNVVDRRLIETGWLSRLADLGVELHVRTVFLQGLLLMPAAARQERFRKWQALWARWDDWLTKNDAQPLDVCLGYALSFPEISRIVVGVDSLAHLRQVVAAARAPAARWPDHVRTDDVALLNPSLWPTN